MGVDCSKKGLTAHGLLFQCSFAVQFCSKVLQCSSAVLFRSAVLQSGVELGPCFSKILARTTFVLVSLPEAENPGQDAIYGDFAVKSSNS